MYDSKSCTLCIEDGLGRVACQTTVCCRSPAIGKRVWEPRRVGAIGRVFSFGRLPRDPTALTQCMILNLAEYVLKMDWGELRVKQLFAAEVLRLEREAESQDASVRRAVPKVLDRFPEIRQLWLRLPNTFSVQAGGPGDHVVTPSLAKFEQKWQPHGGDLAAYVLLGLWHEKSERRCAWHSLTNIYHANLASLGCESQAKTNEFLGCQHGRLHAQHGTWKPPLHFLWIMRQLWAQHGTQKWSLGMRQDTDSDLSKCMFLWLIPQKSMWSRHATRLVHFPCPCLEPYFELRQFNLSLEIEKHLKSFFLFGRVFA